MFFLFLVNIIYINNVRGNCLKFFKSTIRGPRPTKQPSISALFNQISELSESISKGSSKKKDKNWPPKAKPNESTIGTQNVRPNGNVPQEASIVKSADLNEESADKKTVVEDTTLEIFELNNLRGLGKFKAY